MKHLDPHRSDLAKFVSIWLIMIAPREFGTTTDLLWSTKYIEISIISLVCIVIRKILHGWSTIPFMWILFFANNSEYYDGLWPKKNKPPRSKHDFGEGMLPSNLSLPAKTMGKKNKQTALWINRITQDVVLQTDLCILIDAIRTVDHPGRAACALSNLRRPPNTYQSSTSLYQWSGSKQWKCGQVHNSFISIVYMLWWVHFSVVSRRQKRRHNW
jgi:hypothetical protein